MAPEIARRTKQLVMGAGALARRHGRGLRLLHRVGLAGYDQYLETLLQAASHQDPCARAGRRGQPQQLGGGEAQRGAPGGGQDAQEGGQDALGGGQGTNGGEIACLYVLVWY